MSADRYCGCCGREIKSPIANFELDWCTDCQKHRSDDNLPPWERTYFGQFGKACPFEGVMPRRKA